MEIWIMLLMVMKNTIPFEVEIVEITQYFDILKMYSIQILMFQIS